MKEDEELDVKIEKAAKYSKFPGFDLKEDEELDTKIEKIFKIWMT